MVLVRWLGHACFMIQGEKVTIVTDPHNGTDLGIRPPDIKADIVLISHGHYDHYDGLELVSKPDTQVIDSEEGQWEIRGVRIVGIRAYHDKSYGEIRGEIYIYLFEVDGVRFCHLGDLGHVLESEQLEKLERIDVLMIPVGGVFTIDGEEAREVVRQLKPRVVIPMHYKIPGLKLPIEGVEKFLRGMKDVLMLDRDSVEIFKEGDMLKVKADGVIAEIPAQPEEPKVIVLKYA